MQTNFEYESRLSALEPLGDGHGYQHIWKEAAGNAAAGNAHINWFSNQKFYSLISVVEPGDDLIFARLGANDPNFNLRHDPAFIIRKKEKKEATFVSIIEPHGAYDPVTELSEQPFTSLEKVSVLQDDEDYTLIQFSNKGGKSWTLCLANSNASKVADHRLEIEEGVYSWQGPFFLKRNKE